MRSAIILLNFLIVLALDAADLVVFSKDRPMQLDALLHSLHDHVQGLISVHVIYHAASDAFEQGYQILKETYSHVHFIEQSRKAPSKDFKTHVVALFEQLQSEWIMFAVDDIVVTRPFNLREMIAALQRTGAYGFYVRLGANITYCYSENRTSAVPPLKHEGEGVYSWQFGQGKQDWGYPNTLDMTLYRREDMLALCKSYAYRAPNALESEMTRYHPGQRAKGLCFEHSCMVNIPLNMVQDFWTANRQMYGLSAHELNEMFLSGIRIDPSTLYGCHNVSPHAELELHFVQT